MKSRTAGPALLALGLLLSCAGTAPDAPAADAPASAARGDAGPLPVPTDLDYQLGGANDDLPDAVGIVARDRNEAPLEGRFNVCYVNGFQTQPDEKAFWREHWRLVLKRDGRPVTDEVWGEWLLDLRTRDKRRALARIVGRWTDGCAEAGFDAVEYDNLDSFTRSRGLLTRRQALRYAGLLVRRAHRADLPAGQKNLAGYDGTAIGYDFAVAEECGRYDECDRYAASYGDQVLAIEYRDADFAQTCAQYGDAWAVVRRDRARSPPVDTVLCAD